MSHTYLTANVYCRRLFGGNVYKLALSAAAGCPHQDGSVGVGGCVFCSAGGSGDFAASAVLPVSRQIEEAKRMILPGTSPLDGRPSIGETYHKFPILMV